MVHTLQILVFFSSLSFFSTFHLPLGWTGSLTATESCLGAITRQTSKTLYPSPLLHSFAFTLPRLQQHRQLSIPSAVGPRTCTERASCHGAQTFWRFRCRRTPIIEVAILDTRHKSELPHQSVQIQLTTQSRSNAPRSSSRLTRHSVLHSRGSCTAQASSPGEKEKKKKKTNNNPGMIHHNEFTTSNHQTHSLTTRAALRLPTASGYCLPPRHRPRFDLPTSNQ